MNTKTEKLLTSLQEYHAKKSDYVKSLQELRYTDDGMTLNGSPIGITNTAIKQLCSLNGIPFDFFNTRLTHAERVQIFNRLNSNHDDAHTLRFMGETLYGVVSDRYSAIDNIRIQDVLLAAENMGLPLMPVKAQLNPDHTRVTLVPEAAVVGELTQCITITNSENGMGALTMFAGVYRWVCSNGLMIRMTTTSKSRWVHRGNLNIDLPCIDVVLNESTHAVNALYEARAKYLPQSTKVDNMLLIADTLGHKVAATVGKVANEQYHGARTQFDLINAVTRTAQIYRGKEQSDIEVFAGQLLAA